ncbi:XVIPCD domain-containing protein [Lysobacter sp. 1R34A]|uniref:XVIPCD domain-containing protein n=1 Tax=Lysobacter sp. 1R34A TaxID=3445786 RepID=UPI003EEB16B9
MEDQLRTAYKVTQLGAPRGANNLQVNEVVEDFDGLVTHHPKDNRSAHLRGGLVVGGQPGRVHAFIDSEIQEVEFARNGNDYFGLKPHQVLLKKDLMLEDPGFPTGSLKARQVPVPSPVSGYVGRVSHSQGLVDIYDREGGDLIARIRHMEPLAVSEREAVVYGQQIGTQGNAQTGGIHLHIEMDTRYYRQFENYVADLVDGRLPIEPEGRVGVQPRPIADDGTLRLGESSLRIRDLQKHLNDQGYVGADDRPLLEDGVYRLTMQRAVLDFQRDQCLPQTGDIDPALLKRMPALPPPPMDQAIEGLRGRGSSDSVPSSSPIPAGGPCSPPSGTQIDEAGQRRRPLEPFFSSAPEAGSPSPADVPLVQTIRDRLPVAFAQHGPVPPARDLDRIAACLAVECRQRGIGKPDHVVVGHPAPDGSGRHVFVVAGALNDPAHLRAQVAGQQAATTPVQDSLSKLDALQVQRSEGQGLAQQQAEQQRPLSMKV